jgi:cation:H+ antiporter
MLLNDYATLLAGLVCAGIGGEVFVRGGVGLAHWARVSPGIIGATVAAFATSSPELSVSISSAMAGRPQIALGDALGSNVVNVALILALALLVSGLRSPRDTVRRDFPVAVVVPVITGALFLDGVLSRLDGLLLLGLFVAWLVGTITEARKQRSATERVLGERRGWVALTLCILGLAFLVGAGRLIVTGARGIAMSFGVDEFVIGATIVAVGTSVPELATTVIAALRGHSEIGLGTILGSNIFNGLFIVGVAAVIFPISADWREVAVALVFGLLAVVLAFPTRGGLIERRRGVLLLILYGMYLSAVIFPKAA